MNTKDQIRTKLLLKRNSMQQQDVEKKSAKITLDLLNLETVIDAQTFCVYVSHSMEVETHNLIELLLKSDKTVTIPKIVSKGIIEPRIITDFSELLPGSYGILEPLTPQYKNQIDICIVPSIALDLERHRLGHGGGYYDRFLKNNLNMYAIALAYDYQVKLEIPTEEHDQPVDLIVTEKRIF